MVIDEFHHGEHCRNVILHIGHFHVTDGTARRKLLEFRLKLQFIKRIDLLCHMHMITVRDIIFVRHALDHTKALLETFCKFICGGLHRRTVDGITDMFRLLPLTALIVQPLHHLQRKRTGFGICM